jgi:cytochrome c oxidase subunit III
MVAAVQNKYLTGRFSENHYQLGMYVALAAVLMLFTALTSAYIVRSASSTDWQSLAMPRILWLSTTLIVVSSATLEAARRKLKAAVGSSHIKLLSITVILGLGFLVTQLLAWRQLTRQGVYLATSPHSSFFYLLTATHGVHFFGGLLALGYLLIQNRRQFGDELTAKRQVVTDAVTVYWHFMDALWIYLFLLLFLWK